MCSWKDLKSTEDKQQPHPILQSFDSLHSSYETQDLIYILSMYGRHHLMCSQTVILWCIFSAITSGFLDVKFTLMKCYNHPEFRVTC